MKKLFERKENNIIAVLICIIAVLLIVIFADDKDSIVVETDTLLVEVEGTAGSEAEEITSEMVETPVTEPVVEETDIVETVESIEETVVQEVQQTETEDWGSFGQYYMDNPIDNILSEQIAKAMVEAEIRDLQELYRELWLEQYQGMMGFVQKHCVYEEELENYERFAGEIERGHEELQPLIKNVMLDTFEVPSDSPEKATWGWGNGTSSRLAMQEGMYYRNACMLLIPFLNNLDGEYEFITAEEIWSRVEEVTAGSICFLAEVFQSELSIISDDVDKTIAYDYGNWELGENVLSFFRNKDNELVIVNCADESVVAVYEDWSSYDYIGFEAGLEKGHYANWMTIQENVFGQEALLLQMPVGANALLYMVFVNIEGEATPVFYTTDRGLIIDDADGDGSNELISNLEGYFYDWQYDEVYICEAFMPEYVRQLVYEEEYNAWQVWCTDGKIKKGTLDEYGYQLQLVSESVSFEAWDECAVSMKMDTLEAQYWNRRLIQDGIDQSDWDVLQDYGYEDLDKNGQKDLWLLVNSTVKDIEKSTVCIYRNNEEVHIQPMPAYCYTLNITTGDFDNDGDMEFALLAFTGGNGGAGSSAKVLLEEFADGLVEKELPGDLREEEYGDIGFHVNVTFAEGEGEYELSCAAFEENQIIHAEYTRNEEGNYFQANHTTGTVAGHEGRGYYDFFVMEEDGREYLAARQYIYKEGGISDGLCDVIFVFDWTWAEYGYVKECKIVTCGTSQEMLQVEKTIVPASKEEEQRLAFGEVLWHAYQRGTLPDGGILEHTHLSVSKGNSFAIVDVDRDGEEELVLRWTNASMAGAAEFVFGYKDGIVYEELSYVPRIKYYDNGLVEAEHIRGQVGAETLYPYNVYSYNTKEDVYQYVATALSWNKSNLEKNEDGVPFPDELDLDGDGVLYYILTDFSEWPLDVNCLVDGAEYEAWRNSYFGEAEEITFSCQSLTDKNIAALGYPEPYIKIPEPKG